jgi:hypothetical protein
MSTATSGSGRVAEWSTVDIAELLFYRRAPNVPAKWIADILDRLVWLTDDNGDSIWHTLRSWLFGEDAEKVEVALAFDALYLWRSEAEMNQISEKIGARFPMLKGICDQRIAAWHRQFPQGLPGN